MYKFLAPVPASELAEIFCYENGRIFYLKPRGTKKKGDRAGGATGVGYRTVGMCGKKIAEHRIVWALVYGEWPPTILDHINGDGTDNRVENLRLSSEGHNKLNTIKHRSGKPVGVNYRSGKYPGWEAFAPSTYLDRRHRKYRYLGKFKTKEQAAKTVVDFCTGWTPERELKWKK
jgi:hypothetical protein